MAFRLVHSCTKAVLCSCSDVGDVDLVIHGTSQIFVEVVIYILTIVHIEMRKVHVGITEMIGLLDRRHIHLRCCCRYSCSEVVPAFSTNYQESGLRSFHQRR